MFGFQFMPHVFDMISASPQANMNMDYNLWNSQLKRDSIMYMNPGFQASAFLDYPIFATFGNNLLDPSLAIQQTLQAFQNGNWMNGGFNNGNWFTNIFNKPWTNTTSTNNNSTSVADKVKQAEYDTLKSVLQAYKTSNNLTPATKAKIDAALSKSGTLDEKLSAIKDILKILPTDKLKSAVLSDEKLKAKLASCGYNLSEGKLNKDDDATLRGLLEKVKQELNYSPAKYDTLLAQVCSSEADPDILRKISYWNDNNSNIIKMIAEKINTTKGEGTNQKTAVNNLAMSLINKANSIKEAYTSDFTKLNAAQTDVSDALAKVNGNDGFTKPNLEDLATKFEKLYAILRITEASAVGAEAKTEFQKVLNDATGKTIIPDDFIVAETKADLKKEGVTIPEVDSIKEAEIQNDDGVIDDEIDNLETVEEKIEALKDESGNKSIVESAKAGVYKTNTASSTEKPHFYITQDDKILELKDVVDIGADGNCTMKDGSKKSLDEAKNNTTEVNPSDIMQYKATLERIEKLTKDGTDKKLVVCAKKLNDNTLYRSVGKTSDGYSQYFIVKDGKLMQINCKYVDVKSKIQTDTGEKTFDQLTDDDFAEVNNSDILIENKKEIEEKKKNEAVASKVKELIDNKFLEESDCKQPMIYHSVITEKYYIVENGALKELENVTNVLKDGRCWLNKGERGFYKISDTKITRKDADMDELKKREDAYTAGKTLRKQLGGKTDSSLYSIIKREINIFGTYTEADDIYKFLKAYDDERSWYACVNSKICAQIVTEKGIENVEKYIKIIARQTLKLAEEAGLSQYSEEIIKLNSYIEAGASITLYNHEIDDIIDNVLEEYEANKNTNNS